MPSFNQIPTNLRVPFVAVEIDASRAQGGAALLPYKALLMGQKLTAGTLAANTLQRVTSAEQVQTYAGRGSMLHRMAVAWFRNNRFTETWIVALDDNAAGVAATGSVAFSGSPTEAGTLNLYIAGQRVQLAVASGDTGAELATALVAEITAATDLPVTAEVDGTDTAQVNLTARNKGECGNVDVRVNYQDGEETPAGLTVTITAMAAGATNPVLTTALAALGDEWFQVWTVPYTDATSLTAIEDELEDRFGPMRMIDGVCFTASAADHSALGTLGDTRNSPHVSILSQPGANPVTPTYEYAAAVAAAAAYYGNQDPARPFQTLPLVGVLAPAVSDLYTLEERNLLLYDGISTAKADADGTVRIERLITTYKTNAAGASDTAYLDITTMLTLLYLRYTFRNRIMTRYPRHKLMNDGTRVGAGQAYITPKIGKAEALNWFRDMEELGLVENFADFKEALIVERNAQDVNRLDFLLPPDLVNQFIVGAAQVQFRL